MTMPSDPNNRFTELRALCPRCNQGVTVEKFIINNSINGVDGVLTTWACPLCTDVVQVFMAGESAKNAE